MPRINLTDLKVRSLKPPREDRVTYWDTTLEGFGIRVTKAGSKSFIVQAARGSLSATSLRSSLAEARSAARKVFAQKELGQLLPRTISYEKARALFDEHCIRTNKASTAAETKRLLDRHFRLGNRQLKSITPEDISDALDRSQKSPGEQRHAFVAVRAFFNWAIRNRHVPYSPCGLIQLAKAKTRARVLMDDELKRVWIAAGDMGQFGVIVKLLILTGQRRGEIAALQRDWIEEEQITLPSSLTKNGREHTFPIGPLTTALLSTCIETHQPLLFAARGSNNKPFNGWSKSKRALDQLSAVTDWTLHDLRRTFSTNLAALKVPKHVTEKLLNHVSGEDAGVAGIYNRYQLTRHGSLGSPARAIWRGFYVVKWRHTYLTVSSPRSAISTVFTTSSATLSWGITPQGNALALLVVRRPYVRLPPRKPSHSRVSGNYHYTRSGHGIALGRFASPKTVGGYPHRQLVWPGMHAGKLLVRITWDCETRRATHPYQGGCRARFRDLDPPRRPPDHPALALKVIKGGRN